MAKGDTRFANVDAIVRAADAVFGGLRRERLLRGLNDRTYGERLAYYYSRGQRPASLPRGHGRAQRAFFELLAAESVFATASSSPPWWLRCQSSSAPDGVEAGVILCPGWAPSPCFGESRYLLPC